MKLGRLPLAVMGLLIAMASLVSAAPRRVLAEASAEACRVDISGDLVSIAQHGAEAGEAQYRGLVRELAGDWRAKFNRFSTSHHAKALRDYAEALFHPAAAEGARYSRAACEFLKPLSAVAVSGNVVGDAIGGIRPGHILERCSTGVCQPAAISAIADRCDFIAMAIPVSRICETKPVRKGRMP